MGILTDPAVAARAPEGLISPVAASGWPQRHVVVAYTFLACALAYTDRVNIAVAPVAMKEHFGWSQSEKGLVLSAFFAGYLPQLESQGYRVLVKSRKEPWGQTVSRFISPEGLLVGVTFTPEMRE